MKYSKATNYALHTIVYLALLPPGKTIGVKPLAEAQKVSPTYLSKVLTKLVKSGFIESGTGVNGGYQLIKDAKDITFLDIIHAIEGTTSLFNCGLDHTIHDRQNCLIEKVMNEAEQKMEDYLRSQTIEHILQKVDKNIVNRIRSVVN
ncbi:RrF2 family transcriptional regulator [Anoxybacillus rupiensis]|uniref:RrF2 family transcriptional regulator n=1 Tax=Anoxybacteroides rupiense TaxID=311460 RepID=A0ABD5ISB1_9BACL|nr:MULTISPECIES: RrF2 family transcriptional regulator [Anoxybacillus]KXG11209.1 putative HTH-type transcriptional regulator [Anoxybacillus sp. P3H1B]MDE8562526.1 RrF2 family transcriptional regulator [Anoxybacillus rupiensis]MED5050773.1 RrF2 family transcriptional regulator [Anoxybacillus rupiensis]OQM45005.1 transcriptional regulator [Anoxybacillus sp. UARK-01]